MSNKTFKSSILLRVDKTENIQRAYHTKTLTFSCPANWISYAYTNNNETIGDKLECVFAHVKNDDPRIFEIKDKNGNFMGSNMHKIPTDSGTAYLRFLPTIMTPTMCFFNLDLLKEAEKKNIDLTRESLKLNLDVFLQEMHYQKENSSYLVIENVSFFIEDLKRAARIEVQKSTNLTSERFYKSFDKTNPLNIQLVSYKLSDEHELFFDEELIHSAMFTKRKQYEIQSELRLAIPNINFKTPYEYQKDYDYQENLLNVYLPNLHKYAHVFSAKDASSFHFRNYDVTTNSFQFIVLTDNMTLRIDKEVPNA